jgi:site-specific recombinase XerD
VKDAMITNHLLIGDYLTALRQEGKSAWTIRQYGWHLRRMADWLLERSIADPNMVTRRMLRRWGAEIQDCWQPATVKQATVAARSFFTWLAEEGIITKNPAQALKVPRVPMRMQRTLSAAEIQRLLEATSGDDAKAVRDRAMIALLADSGLRAGELCRLLLQDVNLVYHCVTIIGKGNKQAKAYFGIRVGEYLQAWMEIRPVWLEERELIDPGTFFFSLGGIKLGTPLTTSGLRAILRRCGQEAGVEGVSPHAFRRAFATLAIVNGAPTRVVQVFGRWGDVQMVERYTQALHSDAALFMRYSPVDHL